MQASRRLIKLVAEQFVRRKSSGPQATRSTYDDLPVPSGDWKTHYDAKQRKYNTELIIGVGTLVATIVGGNAFGLLHFYNDFPARPATITNYKE